MLVPFTTTDVLIALDAFTGNESAMAAVYRMDNDTWNSVSAYVTGRGFIRVEGQSHRLTWKGRALRRRLTR